MEVMFSENRGHSVYCGVDKPLILPFPACLFDVVFEFSHASRTVQWDSQLPGRGSLTGPWHVKPTCPKPSSFVFWPDLLLQEAHAQIRGPFYSSPFLASCSVSQQSQPAGLRVCISVTPFMMPLLSWALLWLGQKGRYQRWKGLYNNHPSKACAGEMLNYLSRKVCWPVSLWSFGTKVSKVHRGESLWTFIWSPVILDGFHF